MPQDLMDLTSLSQWAHPRVCTVQCPKKPWPHSDVCVPVSYLWSWGAALPTSARPWFWGPSIFIISADLYRCLNGAATWGRLFQTHLKTPLSNPSSLLVIPLLWGSLVLWIKTKFAFVFRSSRNKSLVTQIAENNERLMNIQNPCCHCVRAPCRRGRHFPFLLHGGWGMSPRHKASSLGMGTGLAVQQRGLWWDPHLWRGVFRDGRKGWGYVNCWATWKEEWSVPVSVFTQNKVSTWLKHPEGQRKEP